MSASSARLENLLGAAALGTADALEDAVHDEGLDLRAGMALVALLDFAPSGSVRRLSQAIGLTHSGTVRLVDRLADAGMVRRTEADDPRAVQVRLTASGRRVARSVRLRRQRILARLLSGLTPHQRTAFGAMCEVLITNLTNHRLAQRAAGRTPSGGALCRMCDFAACGRVEGRCPAASAALHALAE